MGNRLVSCLLFGFLLCLTGCSSCSESSPEKVIPKANTSARDGAARVQMRTIYRAEEAFKGKKGRYGTIAELVEMGDLNTDPKDDKLFKYSITASEDRFECIGTPMIYGTTGARSYFIDNTGRLRGADHSGGPASASDPEINE